MTTTIVTRTVAIDAQVSVMFYNDFNRASCELQLTGLRGEICEVIDLPPQVGTLDQLETMLAAATVSGYAVLKELDAEVADFVSTFLEGVS